MWFHVSEKADDIPNPITELRRPKFEYADVQPDEPLLCVSPTIWQCVISVSARKPTVLYAYRIDVLNPKPAAEHDTRISDSGRTGEHRITDAILAANGGKIGTEFLGKLTITQDEILKLKIATAHKGVTPTHVEEMSIVWERSGGVWAMRNAGQRLQVDWNLLRSQT